MTKHECRKKLEIQARRSSPAWQPESTRSPLVFSASSAPSAAFVFFRSSPFPHWQAAACQCHPNRANDECRSTNVERSSKSQARRSSPAWPPVRSISSCLLRALRALRGYSLLRLRGFCLLPHGQAAGCPCHPRPSPFLSALSAASAAFRLPAFPTGKLLLASATPGPLASSPRSPRPPRLESSLCSAARNGARDRPGTGSGPDRRSSTYPPARIQPAWPRTPGDSGR